MKIHYDISMDKVIREKSRGEGSLIGQDTIENVSEPKFFEFEEFSIDTFFLGSIQPQHAVP